VSGTSLEAPLSRLDWLSRLPDGPAGVPCGSRPHQPGVARPSRPTRQDGLGNPCFFGFDPLLQHALCHGERTSGDYSPAGPLRSSTRGAWPKCTSYSGPQSVKAHCALTPRRLDELSIASSGPEVSHGRTSRDVLTYGCKEVPVGPTAAQPHQQ